MLAGELRGADGLPLLREAVDVLASPTAPLAAARARLALGRRPEVPTVEAVALLRDAADIARDCGAGPVVDAALAALAARGEPGGTVRGAAEGAARMTFRERQVFDLTTAGLDVHEVAQRLFLTPKAVHEVLVAATAKVRQGVDDAD